MKFLSVVSVVSLFNLVATQPQCLTAVTVPGATICVLPPGGVPTCASTDIACQSSTSSVSQRWSAISSYLTAACGLSSGLRPVSSADYSCTAPAALATTASTDSTGTTTSIISALTAPETSATAVSTTTKTSSASTAEDVTTTSTTRVAASSASSLSSSVVPTSTGGQAVLKPLTGAEVAIVGFFGALLVLL